MNKRAVTNTIIISIITVLLAFGGIYAFFGKSIQTVKNNTEGLGCRSTLIAQNFTRDKIYMPTFEEECKTLEKTLPMNKKTETKDEFMKEIADLIARTWWSVDEGKIKDLWGEKDSDIFRGDSCFIRYAINFKSGETFDTTKDDFNTYLFTTHYKTFDDTPYTYGAYIYDYGGLGALSILPQARSGTNTKLPSNKIEAGTVYAISVQSARPDSWAVEMYVKSSLLIIDLPALLLNYLGTEDYRVSTLINADLSTKDTVLIFSTLDYAQKEMGCAFI